MSGLGRSRKNLGRRVPAQIANPPNKAINPEWWKDGKNLMRLHPSYEDRRKYEQKKQKKNTR